MHIACGPFTVDTDLQYRPLQNLVAHLKTTKPAVVLLVCTAASDKCYGKSLMYLRACRLARSSKQPILQSNKVKSTPLLLKYFRQNSSAAFANSSTIHPEALSSLCPARATYSVITPCSPSRNSPRSSLTTLYVLIAPAATHELLRYILQRIHMLPNPTRFTLNGVHFAVSSIDVLFHLRKEFFKRAAEVEPLAGPGDPEGQSPSDAMAGLCRHILEQRRSVSLLPFSLNRR